MAQALVYYLVVYPLYGLSRLPLGVLYGVAWGLYVLVYHVLGYRRGVVDTNLRNAFPEKSEAERRAIARRCYRHLANLLLEALKSLTVSRAQVRQMFTLVGTEVVEAQFAQGRSVVLMLGHYGNWEMGANAVALALSRPLYGIYHAIANRRVDALVNRARSRFGMRLIEMRETARHFAAHKDQVMATAFIADQSAPPENSYWTTFLNQDTPFLQGGEKLARKYAQAVVYIEILPLRPGRYELRFELLSENAAETAPGELLERYVRRLEATIRQAPPYWLWTHKRWKHRRPQAS
ncbi:MAG: lysophospholipid acyltransferase family protein [Bacteroidia bacterium]|nr:lysophospholipid acyltransferase family protein [Bacteroidia bacterium]